jgi:hypothetical protein
MGGLEPLRRGVATFVAFVRNEAEGERGHAQIAVGGCVQHFLLELIV